MAPLAHPSWVVAVHVPQQQVNLLPLREGHTAATAEMVAISAAVVVVIVNERIHTKAFLGAPVGTSPAAMLLHMPGATSSIGCARGFHGSLSGRGRVFVP